MAEGKKSFLLYCDLLHTITLLPDDKAGKLFKHILEYVNDQEPETEDILIRLVFEPIKLQLKRDLLSWEEIRQERSEHGRKGGIKSGETRRLKQTKQTLQNRSKSKQTQANEAVTDNVTVTDTVTVTQSIYRDLELSEMTIGKAIEYVKHTQNVDCSKEKIIALFNFFKEKNFAGPENDRKYSTKNKVYSHFLETLKFEKLNGTHQQSPAPIVKLGTSDERTEALRKW